MEDSHYYPFGMQMKGSFSQNVGRDNKYLYNGKELDTDFGLNWYHYGARMYDPTIGRFTGVDPISENFAWVSTYNYAENEPIANIDLHGLQRLHYGAASAYSGEGAKFVKENPKTAAALGVGMIGGPIALVAAAEAGTVATGAFIANEIKDEFLSQLTGGASDLFDLSKNVKNLAELGIKRLDIGGGLNSKYSDALNIDPQAENGFKGTLSDFIEKTGGNVKVGNLTVDNPRFDFLGDASKVLEDGGSITVRGTMSNKFFNKIVNGKADGLSGFNVSNPVKIPNDGFKTTTGNDIKGQMFEINLTRQQ